MKSLFTFQSFTTQTVTTTKPILLILLEKISYRKIFFPPQLVFDTRIKEAVCLNLTVDHQALEVFKKSKAEVQAAQLAGEEWAPGTQGGPVGVDTEERLERDDAPSLIITQEGGGRAGSKQGREQNLDFKTGVTALNFIQEARYIPSPLPAVFSPTFFSHLIKKDSSNICAAKELNSI